MDGGVTRKPVRSRLPQQEARRRYLELGKQAVLDQIATDSRALDDKAIAVGPFARLDAAAVAALDGKTRGAVTNLFGSQASFQVETMALALSAGDWIERIDHPDPAGFEHADAWVDALFAAEAARGPRHGAQTEADYAALWALWLSAVPYGLWSERVSRPSLDEFGQWVGRLAELFGRALAHFGLVLRDGVTLDDLACGTATLIEGAWLSQCLTDRHPGGRDEPVDGLLRRSGRMLWHGAVRDRE